MTLISQLLVNKTTPEKDDFKWGDIYLASPLQSIQSAIILLFLGLLWGRMPWECHPIKQSCSHHSSQEEQKKGQDQGPTLSFQGATTRNDVTSFYCKPPPNVSATSHLPMTPRGDIQISRAWGSKGHVQFQTVLMMYRNPVLMRFIIIHSKVK